MEILFTSEGMSINGGEIDSRFKMATETGQCPGCFIASDPENVHDLIKVVEPLLKNEFGNSYWSKHTYLVWEGNAYNVAYCDGIQLKGCNYSRRHTTPSVTNFPVSSRMIVRLTLKAFDGNEYPGKPYIKLESIDVPEDVIKFKTDSGWVNDWD